jgi:hypothetical protein
MNLKLVFTIKQLSLLVGTSQVYSKFYLIKDKPNWVVA